MGNIYTNTPETAGGQSINNSANDTFKFFDDFNKKQLEFKSTDVDAIQGLFEKKGMGAVAARATAFAVLKQCKLEGVNPFDAIADIQKSSQLELTDTLGEILNLNRLKTSVLGTKSILNRSESVSRNILP